MRLHPLLNCPILLTEGVYEAVQNRVGAVSLDQVRLEGPGTSFKVYGLLQDTPFTDAVGNCYKQAFSCVLKVRACARPCSVPCGGHWTVVWEGRGRVGGVWGLPCPHSSPTQKFFGLVWGAGAGVCLNRKKVMRGGAPLCSLKPPPHRSVKQSLGGGGVGNGNDFGASFGTQIPRRQEKAMSVIVDPSPERIHSSRVGYDGQ